MMIKIVLIGSALAVACAAWGQPAAPPAFEVASVKIAPPCCAPGQWRGNKPNADRLDFQYATLSFCISYAFGVKSYQVFGPDWLNQEHYEIVAKGPAGTTANQLPAMMQALLAERFGLQVHHETREIAGYVLIPGKGASRLKPASAESGDGLGGAQVGMSGTPEGLLRMEFHGAQMSTLINSLASMLGRPVVDESQITGRYDFVLEYARDSSAGAIPGSASDPAPSIFGAIQQLGLKLEARKLSLDTIVVDRAGRAPVSN